MDVSSEKQLELEGSRKGWPLCFLVESAPSDKRLSVENRSGSAEDRSEAARLVCERKYSPYPQTRVCGET